MEENTVKSLNNNMEDIKWLSTFVAFFAMLAIIIFIIVPISTFCGEGYGIFRKFWLFIVVILSASFAIYPKTKYGSWLQRFLAGIALVSLPILFSSTWLIKGTWSYKWLLANFLSLAMLFLCLFISLCLSLRKKANILNDKTNRIFKIMLLFPWGVFLLNLFNLGLFISSLRSNFGNSIISLFIYLFPLLLSLVALIIGVPAIINGGQATRRRLNLGYAGIVLAQLHLLLWYAVVLYYGCVGE